MDGPMSPSLVEIMDSLELFPDGEGAAQPPVVRKPPNPRVVRLPHHHPHPHP